MNLAPTASTTAALALERRARGRGARRPRFRPGRLRALASGRRARPAPAHLRARRDAHRRPEVPEVPLDATVSDALFQITAKRMGMTAVVNEKRHVEGIFTDGDLRRMLERDGDFRALPLAEVMTRRPRTIGPDHLAVEAVELMERYRINQMLVVDEDAILIGALNMHDLFSKKVI